MITTLTLPALAFITAISGIPGLNALPGLRNAVRHKPHPTAADSLPTPWKHASRLALDKLLVLPGLPRTGLGNAPLKINPTFDPRRVTITVDPDSGYYRASVEAGDATVGVPYRSALTGFGTASMRNSFAEKWRQKSRENFNSLGQSTPTARTGLSLPIPVALPSPIQSLLGPGGPALNVSGSESIRLSGTSNWTNLQTGVLGQRKSLFPSLDMQQDLNISLEGQLSDRVKVNLLQNSANQIPLANRIAINYRGEEDDLIQALDLGNTSLSLPGTQYVSYSGQNSGLFGVKLASRLGPLDFTALASKQEGKSERVSYSGGASTQASELWSSQYQKGQYFFLFDPNVPFQNVVRNTFGDDTTLPFPTTLAIDDSTIDLYLDDANYNNDVQTRLGKAVVDPDRVLDGDHFAGQAPDTAFFRGHFDLLKPIDDYEILPDYYLFGKFQYKIIRLKHPIDPSSNMCLAATYRASVVDPQNGALGTRVAVGGRLLSSTSGDPDSGFVLLKMLRAPRSRLTPDPNDGSVFDPAGAFEPVRELEMKNFYSLNGSGIDPVSFKLTIQRGRDSPPNTFLTSQSGVRVPYFEAIGLDNLKEDVVPPTAGQDGKIDGTLATATGLQSSTRYFVDYVNGVLFLPEPRPFAPRIVGEKRKPFDVLMDKTRNRRAHLIGAAGTDTLANPQAYDSYNESQQTLGGSQYFIETEFAAQRGGGEINLKAGGILEGSEVVTVNGERWTRDHDYTIDYDIGHISLKRKLAPTDQLNIDYSYAPLFAQASKTLLGSAFRLEGRDRSLGGAFLYESKGAQDLRPRLGEEPSRTLITDLNTDWRFRPDFLTRLVDRLPGVRTTTPSEFNFQAEAGASFPNPNTRNEVFIDDMEGVRDAASLTLSASSWKWSSVPSIPLALSHGVALGTASLLDPAHYPNHHLAEIHWYPVSTVIKEKELKPTLTDAQGANNQHTVLALSVPRFPHSAQPTDSLWFGLTYPLDKTGVDLSRSQFIEFWLDDFRDRHHAPQDSIPRIRGQKVRMHIDLGIVSEGMLRAPNERPDSTLHTEDRVRDGQLTVAGSINEDTGYDMLLDAQEKANLERDPTLLADLSTADPNTDPEGDDYHDPISQYKDLDPRKYQYINGSENNHTLVTYPETDDLNLDGTLNTDEDYYEYTVDLDGSSPYLQTDVWRDFPGKGVSEDNGWRRYRIPIDDSLRVQFGNPDLSIARHVRIWFENLRAVDDTTIVTTAERKPLMLLGSFDIVGSRWLARDLTKFQRDTVHTTLTLNSVNTLDNADVYSPPFDPGQTRTTNQALTRREQSMDLEFTELAPNDTLEAFRTFSLEENYSRYGALDWYATGFDVTGYDAAPTDSLFYFVRFATDELGQNYYEIKRPLPSSKRGSPINWKQVKIGIAAISNLKLQPDFPKTAPIVYRAALGDPGDSVIVVGQPSFTRLRRISFGLINAHVGDAYSGRRYHGGQLWFDEIRATDVAKDVGYANRVLVNGRFANLLSYNVSWNSRDADFLSVGESRGTGSRNTNLAVTSQFDLHRFFEGTGIQLPVTMTYSKNSSKPRFSAGDDVIRTGEQQALSETRSEQKSFSTQYSRIWTDRSNPFLRYTLGGVSALMSRNEGTAVNPSGAAKNEATNANVSWNISPRTLLSVPLPFGKKTRFFFLPERAGWNYQVATNHSVSSTRATDGTGELQQSNDVRSRSATLDFSADSRPVDLITHHIEGHRILNLDGVPLDHIGFVNFGKLTAWRQNFSANFQVQRGAWLRPRLTWGSNYNQNNEVQSPGLSVRGIQNGQNIQMSWDLPFDQLVAPHPYVAPQETVQPPAKPDSGAVDTTLKVTAPRPKRKAPPFRWQDLASRLGPIQTDANLSRTSAYSRLTGTPDFLYLVGLTDNPGISGDRVRVIAASGNTVATGLAWRTNARTRMPLAYQSALSMRFSYGDETNNSNGVDNRKNDLRFPDIDVDYGKLPDVLQLKRFVKDAQIRTAWSTSYSTIYQGSRTLKTQDSRTNDLHPLLSLRGTLRGGTTADLSMNVRNTLSKVYQFGTSQQIDNNTDVNLTLSRQYTQGQKVSFLGKTSTVRSNVSLQLATVYSHHKAETRTAFGGLPQSPTDEHRLSVTGTGTYGFSSSVTGSAVLGYSNINDTARNQIRRSVRVELRAQFTF